MNNDLLKKKCKSCEEKTKPFSKEESLSYLNQIEGWVINDEATQISKEFKFVDFIGAINFVNLVADIAEMEGHHPDIYISYNKVKLNLYTHSISGLSENDFILAAKINAHKI